MSYSSLCSRVIWIALVDVVQCSKETCTQGTSRVEWSSRNKQGWARLSRVRHIICSGAYVTVAGLVLDVTVAGLVLFPHCPRMNRFSGGTHREDARSRPNTEPFR